MERRLKERLTGAAVLIALAIIFIPMVLDDTVMQETGITETNIPPKPAPLQGSRIIPLADPAPASSPVTVTEETENTPGAAGSGEHGAEGVPYGKSENEPDLPPDEAVKAADEKAELPRDKTVQAAAAEDSRGLTAWVVQLGSFSSQENADSLVNELRAEGYPAYVEEISVEEGIRHRVRVGPELVREDAEKLLGTLGDKYNLNGIILAYP